VDAAATAGSSSDELPDAFTRTQIHIAAGMLAVRLAVNTDEAIDRLRAYSYARGRPISSVAADIVARRLTLPD
jgi:AmiR/NasT family two-component response regulator